MSLYITWNTSLFLFFLVEFFSSHTTQDHGRHSFALGDEPTTDPTAASASGRRRCRAPAARRGAPPQHRHRLHPARSTSRTPPPPRWWTASRAAPATSSASSAQHQWVAEIVAAAGLPHECAPIVNDFGHVWF